MEKFESDIINSINVLQQGGTILYPTDTIWGIGCDATNAHAIQKIYQLKKREEKKSMIILLAHQGDIKNYVLHPSKKIIDFITQQKTPTTAIYNNAFNLPRGLINADGSIAIRIVKDAFCIAILHQLRKPLVSTSANISGETPPENFSMINPKIKDGVDYVVQHRQDENILHQPSSIIKLDNNGIVRIR